MNILTNPFFQWPCSATMLLLVILKKSRILSKTPLTFFSTKNLNFERLEKTYYIGCILHQIGCFWRFSTKLKSFSEQPILFSKSLFFVTCWEISLIQSHFTANLLFLTILKKIIFFLKTYLFFSKKLKLERFEKTYLFGRILQQICYLYHFLKNRIFFSKKPIQFLKKTPNFRKFWEFLLFQWPCSVTLLLLAILKKPRIFSKTQSIFFSKENQFLNVLRNLTQSVAFCIKSVAFSGLQKKLKVFFRKTNLFLSRKSHFFNVLRDLTNSVASYNNYFYL